MDLDNNNNSRRSSSSWGDLEDSQTTTAMINLHPERRKELLNNQQQDTTAKTGTSKYFTHSKTQIPRGEMEIDGREDSQSEAAKLQDREDDDEDDSPLKPTNRKRQMKLDFRDGSLGTKKPLINPINRNDSRRLALRDVAEETMVLLPGLLATRPDITNESFLCQREPLDAKFCPRLRPVTITVHNHDTIDVALSLAKARQPSQRNTKPVAILNMANANHPGGGWLHGALAQEEALCYRSSLSKTLHRKHYPIPEDAAIYSPNVMIIRNSMAQGHNLLDFRNPAELKLIAVISCAAVCLPPLKKYPNGQRTYAVAKDKRLMMEKMRIILRTAIRNRHRDLVLGALGCGAFGNPNHEVAAMWKDVLQEPAFRGGWWENVVFAVMGSGAPGDNFRVFHDELNGLVLN